MSCVSETVRLRAAEPADVDMMYSLENDPALWHLGTTTVPYSREALSRFISDTALDIYADRQVRLVVEAGRQAVGCADLYDVDARNAHADVAIGLLPEWRGRGVGLRAVRLLADFAFGHLGLCALRAIVPAGNEPSLRAFAAAGFRHAGTLTGWVRRGDSFDDAHILIMNHHANQ